MRNSAVAPQVVIQRAVISSIKYLALSYCYISIIKYKDDFIFTGAILRFIFNRKPRVI